MKSTLLAVLFALVLMGGAFLLSRRPVTSPISDGNNISIVDGKQIIEIDAKGGYFPRQTIAKANMPTTLRVNTKGTFDCSSALSIPAIGYRGNLPSNGKTDIEIPAQKSGESIRGICAMGMYNFSINFE